MAVYEGARPRTITLPRGPRLAEGPTLGRAAHAHGGPGRPPPGPLGLVLGAIVGRRSCSRSSGSPRWSASPRPATTSAGCEVTRGRLDVAGAGPALRPEPPRPRAGDPQAGARRGPRPAGRSPRPAGPLSDRATMLGRTDSRTRLLVLLVVFVVAAVALIGRLAYWQVLAARRRSPRRPSPRRRSASRSRAGAARSTTGAGPWSWPRPSSATGWWPRPTS